MKIFQSQCFAILFLATPILFAQGSGDFVITKSVIAGGGSTSADVGNVFSITGTIGQPNAGDNSNGPPFNIRSGFWTRSFAPTAAGAVVGGRVTRYTDVGIYGAVLTLTGGGLTSPRIARTNNLGYFSFEDIQVGQSYVLTVSHKRYGFPQPSIFFSLVDDLTDITFEAGWEN